MSSVSPAESVPSQSVRSLAVQGAYWTVAGFGGAQVLRFAFNLLLTRLLVPEYFGLATLLFTIHTGLNLFCEIGAGVIVVRDPRGEEPRFLHTVWTVQILRGALLGGVCALLASPVAEFYRDARLEFLLPLLGLTSVIAGLHSVSLLVLRRRMQVKELVLLELGTQAIGGCAMIAWAWVRPDVTSLLVNPFVAVLVRLIWGYLLRPQPTHRWALERETLRVLFGFGGWLWISAILGYFAMQSDRLILGRLFPLNLLGVYGIAAALAEMPRSLLMALAANVVFPAYSRWTGESRADFAAKVWRMRRLMLMGSAFAIASVATGGDWIIRLLYDRRYAAAAWMLPMLVIGIWPSALYQSIEGALVSVGQPRYSAIANLFKIVFTAAGVPLAFWWGGAFPAVLVIALNDLPCCLPIGFGLWREGLLHISQDVWATLLVLALIAALALLRWSLGFGFALETAL